MPKLHTVGNNLASRILIWLVRLYQQTAPQRIRAACRFEPSGSNYMILAVQKYGGMKGLLKGLRRIARCNPYNKKCGVDYP
jgi:putative membrane protein insertion efficiency factor